VIPHLLIWIELRRISREPLDMKPRVEAEKLFYLLAIMDSAAIPQEHNVPSNLLQEVAQEEDHLVLRNVLSVEMGVEVDALASMGDGDRRDCGHSVVTVAVPDDGCLAARCPGSTDVGHQKESALI